MDMADPHGRRLREYDAWAEELADYFRAETEAGGAMAAGEAAALMGLAEAIRAAVAAWAVPLRRMHAARPLDPRRAAALVAETVFDEILIAPAWRLLAAALELAP
jgi:hypothetical protein